MTCYAVGALLPEPEPVRGQEGAFIFPERADRLDPVAGWIAAAHLSGDLIE